MTELSDIIAAEVLSRFEGYSAPFRIEQGENHIALFDASGQMLMGVAGTDLGILAFRIVEDFKRRVKRNPASAANGRNGGRPRIAACTCGQSPHLSKCPIYRQEYRAKKLLK